MTHDKLLAEWFWIDRWMGSTGVLLPMEPRGVYREMLTQAWRRGARLPNDHEAIRRAIGATLKEWKRCWPRVEKFWRVDNDHLVNDTQLEVYAEAMALFKRRSESGKLGNQTRWGNRKDDHKPIANGIANPIANTSPPSPSPSPEEIKQIPLDERWEQFKATYPGPGRQGGRMALQFFIDACQSVGFETVMAGLARYCASKKVREGYVIGMEKWLEKTMWIQEPEPEPTATDDVAAMEKHLAKIDADRAARGR